MTIATVVRESREVVLAAIILVGVLLVIDAGALGDPALVPSLLPFAFLVVAALVPLTPARVGAWVGAIALLALVARNASYLGLAYPAVAVGFILALQRFLGRRGRP